MFVYKSHCAQELTKGFTDINVLIISFNFSLVARYLLKFTRWSLQNSLATRCRSCSLQKVTRSSLQNSLVTRCRSCSLQK